ncbi:hypothetical protein HMI54_015362 [Coelomomyces lativittatus]|nr:hypothetical protein HMI56_006751 [Coelomomyces lativittatus]KAJ1512910.1 hypothetical protein HMI54_015362 [Coelomomyces lativittatus]KAJ1516501.1 hypothetical protein HMI55_002113 [Coelomomyces lativittatus]
MSDSDSKAAKWMVSAKKHITKPSIALFWKPDHEAAAQAFEQAATLYKSINPGQAIQAYEESSKQWTLANAHFMAAKTMELAAQIASKQASFSSKDTSVSKMYSQAAQSYLMGDTFERAAEAYEKAAKASESTTPDQAVVYYKKCIELYEQEERYRVSVDPIKRALAFTLQSKRPSEETLYFFDRLHSVYEKVQNQHGLSRTSLSLIIYYLSIEDMVAAKKELDTHLSHDPKEDYTCAQTLIQAIDDVNVDQWTAWKASPWLQFLDPWILNLALHAIHLPHDPSRRPEEEEGSMHDAEDNPDLSSKFTSAHDFGMGEEEDDDIC